VSKDTASGIVQTPETPIKPTSSVPDQPEPSPDNLKQSLPNGSEGIEAPDGLASRDKKASHVARSSEQRVLPGDSVPASKPPLAQSGFDKSIRAVLNRYEAYFVSGDLSVLDSLYMSSARENDLDGYSAIKTFYTSLFNVTSERSAQITVENTVGDGYLSARVTGSIAIEYANLARRYTSKRRFDMLIIRVQSGYRIAAFDWLSSSPNANRI